MVEKNPEDWEEIRMNCLDIAFHFLTYFPPKKVENIVDIAIKVAQKMEGFVVGEKPNSNPSKGGELIEGEDRGY